ncbi:MAG TPA: hypothetical protein VGM18_00840 [Candidatus Sulfotelmatobacter sp.]|jgi:hypothetical protein
MRHALLSVILLGTFILVAAAQDSVTVTSDPRDFSRPISTVINQIRQREKVSITYEDPRYANAAEIEDVTAQVAKGSELEKRYGPRILVPKGHPLTFVYSPADMHNPDGAKATVERLLQEYASLGGPAFAVIGDNARLHVVPDEILNSSGTRVQQGSVLDSLITIPAARRDGGELLQAICDEIKKQSGYDVGIGPSAPDNYLAQYTTSEGITNKTAREALQDLLDRATPPSTFVWDLYFDPADSGYGLNFAYVGPAAGPVPMAK